MPGSSLHELDEDSAGALGMQKSDVMAARSGPPFLVDETDSRRPKPVERRIEVGHSVGNVVQTGTLAVEESLHRGFRRSGLQKLDSGVPGAYESDVHALSLNALDS